VNSPHDRNRMPRDPFAEIYGPTETKKKGGSFFGGIVRFALLVCIGLGAGAAGMALQSYFYFTSNLPSIEKLKNYSPPIITRLYSDKGNCVAEFATERRVVLPIDQIPKLLQNAYVSAEDRHFWEHGGVDAQGIIRAMKKNLMDQRITGGGSTITQQLAKIFLLTPERKYKRKIKEAILATKIEKELSKEQILYLYLNQIYLGSSAYGVEAAAQMYFEKSVKDLSIAECAMLAALPKKPSKLSPRENLEAALDRRAYVLKRMLEDEYISKPEYDEAMNEQPRISTKTHPQIIAAADFVGHVQKYVEAKYGPEALWKEGLQVYTTVDLEKTKIAQDSMDAGLRELDKREGYRGPLKTLTVKEVMEFLEQKTHSMKQPLRFGDLTEGVVTHIDNENIYVRMGSYVNGSTKKEYVGQIKIDPNPKWWVRQPFIKAEKRIRNFAPGDLPFQVGDLILVRLVDPNIRRRELYKQKFGRTDPQMANYKEYTEDMVTYFPLEPEQEPLVQSALMMRENRSGYVRVLLGGSGSSESKYNRATQAKRQAGSSFKPVIYAAALNKGFTPADIILDSPLAIPTANGEVWRPKNYGGGNAGPVTFRNCLVKSRNVPTVKILQQIGREHAKAYARKLGYTCHLGDDLTWALGTTGVSLEEQLNAYAVFANRGYGIPNVYVKKIVDRNGKVLEENDPPVLLDDSNQPEQPTLQKVSHEPGATVTVDAENPDRNAPIVRRKIDEGTAYIMTTMLQGVIQEGTATNLKRIVGRPDIAGKTGTTNDSIDAWFMGYSPDYTCGVWVGFDEESSIGEGETGGKAAAPIWGYFMRKVLKDKPVKEFPIPQSVEFRRVDPRTGLVTSSAEGVQEVFKTGSGTVAAEPKLNKGSRWDYSGSDLDQF
jgi:penicillin-binding protein 1A